jgi:hypothetical protein
MAFVYSKATFAGIVTSLGNSDAFLQAAQTGTATSGLSQLQTARGDVADSLGDNSITSADFDATNTLAASLRTAEGNAPSTASSAYNGSLTALDTYISTVTGSTVKEYWNSKSSDRTMTFTDNFRSFFRRVKADEVIVQLYSVTMPSAGSTTTISSVGSTTNMIPALYEVRTDTAIGSSFVANFTCVKTGGSSDLVSLTVNAGTAISNYFSIGSTTKYLYISSFSGTGTSGNAISVWTR